MRIAITGSSGFVGPHVVAMARARGMAVRTITRRATDAAAGVEQEVVPEPWTSADFGAALRQVDTVIHLAGRAHVMRETAPDPAALFRQVNVDASLALARAAGDAGVRRLVYVSSIKVNGEATTGRPFTETDPPAPRDPYGVSKAEAEAKLTVLAEAAGLELVIARPPLMYGPGVKGNLLRLFQLVDRGWPLPLGGIENRRTLLGVRNFASLLVLLAEHPAARGVYLAGDEESLSTPQLVREIGVALDRDPRLLPCPVGLARWIGRITGRSGALERLTGSLEIDTRHAHQQLGWRPPLSRTAELAACAAWYRASLTP